MTSLLSNYTFILVLLSCIMLSVVSAIVGLIIILQKQSLLGDAISHSSFPGVILAFLILQIPSSFLLIGGIVFGVLASFCIKFIKDNTKLNFDSILALILSSFFGLGMVLYTFVDKLHLNNQIDLKKYIFGQASSILTTDMYIILGFTLFSLFLIILLWKEIKLFIFDEIFCKISTFNPKLIGFIIFSIITITIILQLQTIGLILLTAMLVSPGVASLQWSRNYLVVMLLSVVFSIFATTLGTIISFTHLHVPTGPVIVIIISIISLFSLFFGKYGIVPDKIYYKKTKGIK